MSAGAKRRCLSPDCQAPDWQLQKNGYCVPCNTAMKKFEKKFQQSTELEYERTKQIELQERIVTVEKQTFGIAAGGSVPENWKQVRTRAEVIEEKKRELQRREQQRQQYEEPDPRLSTASTDSPKRRGSISFIGPGGWHCSKCKFRNDPTANACEVCEHPKEQYDSDSGDQPSPRLTGAAAARGLPRLSANDILTKDIMPARRSSLGNKVPSSPAHGNATLGTSGGGRGSGVGRQSNPDSSPRGSINTSERNSASYDSGSDQASASPAAARPDSFAKSAAISAAAVAGALAAYSAAASGTGVELDRALAAEIAQDVDAHVIATIQEEDEQSFPKPVLEREQLPKGDWSTELFDCCSPLPVFLGGPAMAGPGDNTSAKKKQQQQQQQTGTSGSSRKSGSVDSRNDVTVSKSNARTAAVVQGKLSSEHALIMDAYSCSTCATSCFIPCHQVTRNMEEFHGAEQDTSSMCCTSWACCLPPFLCIHACMRRREVAAGYRIESGCCTDCLSSSFCYPCALAQVYREIAMRREYRARRRSFDLKLQGWERARQVRVLRRLEREAQVESGDVELIVDPIQLGMTPGALSMSPGSSARRRSLDESNATGAQQQQQQQQGASQGSGGSGVGIQASESFSDSSDPSAATPATAPSAGPAMQPNLVKAFSVRGGKLTTGPAAPLHVPGAHVMASASRTRGISTRGPASNAMLGAAGPLSPSGSGSGSGVGHKKNNLPPTHRQHSHSGHADNEYDEEEEEEEDEDIYVEE